ncbi:MAG: hypothetical protein JKY58_08350 [Pseudomonas sp.]|nr:hypothetical protein [Pseudomonas sp.]
MARMNLNNTSICEVDLHKIDFDPQVKQIINSANPMAICRNSKSDFNPLNIEFLLIAFPIVGYFKGDQFLLCSGLFSFNTIAQILNGNEIKIQVTTFNEKPKPKSVRTLFLIYLVCQMVNHIFISDSSHIGTFLNSWFSKDDNAKSIQASKEWQTLFPNLTTKEVLARHLGIRKGNL